MGSGQLGLHLHLGGSQELKLCQCLQGFYHSSGLHAIQELSKPDRQPRQALYGLMWVVKIDEYRSKKAGRQVLRQVAGEGLYQHD